MSWFKRADAGEEDKQRLLYVRPKTTDAEVEMFLEHERLVDAGLLDPDQPTPWGHLVHLRRMEAEFRPQERRLIRAVLGLTGEQP